MDLLVLIVAFFEAIGDTINETIRKRQAQEKRRRYENIDFDNIEAVFFCGTEQAYAFEVEEEYDPRASYGLSQMNGAPCYATKKVFYKVENGLNFCFTIRYKNSTEIYRVFHETSPLTQRLLNFKNHPDYDCDLFHTYCEVAFDESGRTYYYRVKNLDLEIGDKVFVPAGYKNEKKVATVESIEDFIGYDAPYPLEKTKFIIGKVE